jgi:hypothetical protein
MMSAFQSFFAFVRQGKSTFESIFTLLTCVGILSFALGFVVWSIYLQSLGFLTKDLFQPVFIYSGLAFAIVYTACAATWSKLLKKPHPKAATICSLLLLFLYSLLLFPFIPGAFGGGAPRAFAIVGTPAQIEYLNNFAIKSASPIQTEQLCVAYEDEKQIVLVLNDRILSLNKEEYGDFVSLPSVEWNMFKFGCSLNVITNTMALRSVNGSNSLFCKSPS